MSGYDLKKWADWSLRFFYWAPSYSQIYGELAKLETLGYATSRVVSTDDVRGKRLYRITPEGEAAVTEWADEAPVEPAVLKHGVMLRWSARYYEDERNRADAMLKDLEEVANKRGSSSPARTKAARRSSEELRTRSL